MEYKSGKETSDQCEGKSEFLANTDLFTSRPLSYQTVASTSKGTLFVWVVDGRNKHKAFASMNKQSSPLHFLSVSKKIGSFLSCHIFSKSNP